MDRRSFFKYLGIGAATAVVAPKILAQEPRKRGFITKQWTKKIFDDRVENKMKSLGLSKDQSKGMGWKAFWKFSKIAKIDEASAQEILDSINMEAVAEMEDKWKKSLDKICELHMTELERMKKDIERIKGNV